MLARLLFEALRRRRRERIVGLCTVAFGVAVLAALLHLAVQGRDRMGLDLRGYGANLLIKPVASGAGAGEALLRESDLPALKQVFWRNNVVAFAPELTATVEAGGGFLTIVGAWIDHAVSLPEGAWRTGEMALEPAWQGPGAVDGRLPREGALPPELLVGARVAAARGWRVGDMVTLARGDVRQDARVVGLLHAGDAWEDRALGDLALTQLLLGRDGQVERVRVSVLAKTDDELCRRPLGSLSAADQERRSCSPYLAVVGEQLAQAMDGAVSEPITAVVEAETAYRTRLEALLALLAASAATLTALGVYGSVRAALAERRAEMGLMRALGASARGVFGLFVAESVVVGLAGAVVGSLLGYGLAAALSQAVFGAPLPWHGAALPLLLPAGALLAAIGGGLAVAQALRAEPVDLLGATP